MYILYTNIYMHCEVRNIYAIDADSNIIEDFPSLAEEHIRELIIGVYQLKTAKSYAAEFEILVSNEVPNIGCSKIQSCQKVLSVY